MIEEYNLPNFLTEAMKVWLTQYYAENFESITEIGLFEWAFKPNKRNPLKPRRMPIIGQSIKLKTSIFFRYIYLLEIDSETIHVFICSGFCLSGHKVAHEYNWDGNMFFKNPKRLFSMIS
jgi:hypothetical protein